MPTAVVYYSKSGNTRFAADELGRRLQAPVVAVEAGSPREYRGILGFIRGGFRSVRQKSSTIKGEPWNELTGVDEIYLLSPIWAGSANPVINGFLDNADLRGKTVHVATFQADPKGDRAPVVHQYLKRRIAECGGSPGRTWALESEAPGKFAGEDKLRAQVDRILA